MNQTISSLKVDSVVQEKWHALMARLRALGSVVVAFSGGVDSSFLAVAAHQALAPHMLAVTIRSQVETVGLMDTAAALADQFGFPHQFVNTDKLQDAVLCGKHAEPLLCL